MKYTIGITRLAIVHGEIEIEASSPEKAAKVALRKAKHNDHLVDWSIDSLYASRHEDSHICAISAVDEGGGDHDIGDLSVSPC